MENAHVLRYRAQSIILGNRNGNSLNQPVIEGNVNNLKSHLLQIKGNEQGVYLDSHHRETPSTLTSLKEKQKALQQKWDQYCMDQLKIGNARPKIKTPEFQVEYDKLIARILVAEEELSWLEQKLQEAQEQQQKARPSLLMHPKYWGGGQLKDGVLVSVGPWSVGMDEEGLLRISDETSPYDTMPVWRFRAEITKPMSQEFVHRNKMEETKAISEGIARKAVKYPLPGRWDKKSDLIEYENYSNETIKKLKKEN